MMLEELMMDRKMEVRIQIHWILESLEMLPVMTSWSFVAAHGAELLGSPMFYEQLFLTLKQLEDELFARDGQRLDGLLQV